MKSQRKVERDRVKREAARNRARATGTPQADPDLPVEDTDEPVDDLDLHIARSVAGYYDD